MIDVMLGIILMPIALIAAAFTFLLLVVTIVAFKEAKKQKKDCQFFDNSKKI